MSARLLVVDDESIIRRLVIHTLKSMEIETVSAEAGYAGIEIGSQEMFDIILVDINLPDIDGFEVIGQLRQLPHLAQVPIIAFTARSQPEDQPRAYEVGATGFLYKPFSTQELRDLVKLHLG